MDKDKYNKYIVLFKESSEGFRCNGDFAVIVESKDKPSKELLNNNYSVVTEYCQNLSEPECEGCNGSRVISFIIELYTIEKAKVLGLEDKVLRL